MSNIYRNNVSHLYSQSIQQTDVQTYTNTQIKTGKPIEWSFNLIIPAFFPKFRQAMIAVLSK